MRLMDTGRGRKGTTEAITLGPKGTWAQAEYDKGGKPEGVRQAQDRARNSFRPPGMEGKQGRVVAAIRRGCRPGGRLLHDRARGAGEESGATGDRSGIEG